MNRNQYISLFAMLVALAIFPILVNAQSWQLMSGPPSGNAEIVDLAAGFYQQMSYTAYSIQNSGGSNYLYQSVSNGISWNQITLPLSNPCVVTCDPNNPDHVITICRPSNAYAYFSTNNGVSWTESNLINASNVYPLRLAISSASTQNILLGLQHVSSFTSMKRSTNGGANWSDVPAFNTTYPTSIYAVNWNPANGSKALAGGMYVTGGTNGVFYTVDGGSTWNRSGTFGDGTSSTDIYTVATFTTGATDYGFAASWDGKLYLSSNPYSAQATWTNITNRLSLSANDYVNDLQVGNATVVFAAASNGLYKSTDNGVNWTGCQASFRDQNLVRLAIPTTATDMFAAGSYNIYKSNNVFNTWWMERSATTTPSSTDAFAANADLYLGAPSDSWVIERKTSGYPTWYPIPFGCSEDFRQKSIAFQTSAATTAFAAGYRIDEGNTVATLMRSQSGGEFNSWSAVQDNDVAGSDYQYDGIVVDPANSSRIFTYGLSNTNDNLNVTADGGDNFSNVSIPSGAGTTNASEVVTMAIDSSSHAGNNYSLYVYAGIYGGTDGGFWKSTNGGSAWSRITIVTGQPTAAVRSMALNPKQGATIYAAVWDEGTTGCKLRKTTNRGSSWTTTNAPGNVIQVIMHPSYPTSANYLWIITYLSGNNHVYKTTDGGSNWDEVSGASGAVYALNRDLTSNALIYAQTSAGVYKVDPEPEAPSSVTVVAYKVGTLCEEDGPIGGGGDDDGADPNSLGPPPCTKYACVQWTTCSEADHNTYKIYRSTSLNSGYSNIATGGNVTGGYADYSVELPSGTTYYYKVTSVDQSGNESVLSEDYGSTEGLGKAAVNWNQKAHVFALYQNAPNPFNPSTKIQYSLAQGSNVTLKLYNLLGEEVKTVVDEYQGSGPHATSFDAGNLPSGMYYYRLQAGKYSDVKKMLLVK